MIHARSLSYAVAGSLFLGAVMTLGDLVWAALHLRHRIAYGVAHGAVMCLCIGVLVAGRFGRPAIGAVLGVAIGVAAAGTFYLFAPVFRWGAMLPAWMLFWILFALLQQRLSAERRASAIARGLVAAVLSGVAFYLISGIWTRPAPGGPRYLVNFFSWSFAFLPGFLSLFWSSRKD